MSTPPPSAPVPPPRLTGLATASLVLGILAITAFSILAGLPALLLGALALYKLFQAPGRRAGKATAAAGTVLGGLSVIMLPFMPPLFVPDLSRARAAADQAACLHNVHLCAMACAHYAEDHGMALPKTWADVQPYLGDAPLALHNLHCPRTADADLSYALVPSRRLSELTHPEHIVVVREIHANHQGKRIVGYADGHVELQTGP